MSDIGKLVKGVLSGEIKLDTLSGEQQKVVETVVQLMKTKLAKKGQEIVDVPKGQVEVCSGLSAGM